ncbi:MAG: acyl-CoA dehydrogenase [Actinobacteria bacterium]|nr:acyl-CoA dehydrogenase [Actinomycetota bacterium]
MYIGYDEKQEALRKELRDYYNELLTPEIRDALAAEEGTGPVHREIVGKMGRDGWLTVGWPEEYGGRGYSAVEQFVMFDESVAIGAPIPMLTVNTVGPTLMQYGTQEQKDFFLPKISRGEITFCVGYSEPDAGTDLASLQCRAVRDGDEFVINGQKTWTSLARDADYIWLAARTNPDVKKHKGISLFCIPMDTPGLSIEPLHLLSSHNINHTFFDDVRVPAFNLLGEEGAGWQIAMATAGFERGLMLRSPARFQQATRRLVSLYREHSTDILDPSVEDDVVRCYMDAEAYALSTYQTASRLVKGGSIGPEASCNKIFWSELDLRIHHTAMRILGPRGEIEPETPALADELGTWLDGFLFAQSGPIYAGTNEIQRNIIAERVLGMPRR